MKPSHPNGRFVGWQKPMNLITREIGIDMGHRVTNHGSKCRNVHGHRYTIQVILQGVLVTEGEQEGMVLDFGFLKNMMMELIDAPCDHGLCLWIKDPLLTGIFAISLVPALSIIEGYLASGATAVHAQWDGGKLYVLNVVPTAENLAKHWYELLREPVDKATDGLARIHAVRVWETPNCVAEYVG